MKNITAADLRAARKARLATTKGTTSAANTAPQSQAVTKKAEDALLVTQTDDQQVLPVDKAEKSQPVPPPMADAAPAGMAPAAEAPAGEGALLIEVAPAGDEPAAPAEIAEEIAEEMPVEEMPAEEAELSARVVDPAQVSASARIDVVGPFEKNADAFWIVLADGEPLAKIAMGDQKISDVARNSDTFRKMFLHEDYARSIKSAASKTPILKLLSDMNARPYTASVTRTAAYAAISDKAAKDSKSEIQKKQAKFRDDFLSMLNLVAEAQVKNFLPRNPLKEALFKALKKAGTHDPTPVIESAFIEAGPAHFEIMANQAMKWLDYNAESLADIRQAIDEMGTGSRSFAYNEAPAAAPQAFAAPAAQRPVPSSDANVPIVTAGSHAPASETDRIRDIFGFRSRMHGRVTPPRG